MNIASPYIVRSNKNFINRKREWQLLKEVDDRKDSAFIVVSVVGNLFREMVSI
jgi:hypothetical protein